MRKNLRKSKRKFITFGAPKIEKEEINGGRGNVKRMVGDRTKVTKFEKAFINYKKQKML